MKHSYERKTTCHWQARFSSFFPEKLPGIIFQGKWMVVFIFHLAQSFQTCLNVYRFSVFLLFKFLQSMQCLENYNFVHMEEFVFLIWLYVIWMELHGIGTHKRMDAWYWYLTKTFCIFVCYRLCGEFIEKICIRYSTVDWMFLVLFFVFC